MLSSPGNQTVNLPQSHLDQHEMMIIPNNETLSECPRVVVPANRKRGNISNIPNSNNRCEAGGTFIILDWVDGIKFAGSSDMFMKDDQIWFKGDGCDDPSGTMSRISSDGRLATKTASWKPMSKQQLKQETIFIVAMTSWTSHSKMREDLLFVCLSVVLRQQTTKTKILGEVCNYRVVSRKQSTQCRTRCTIYCRDGTSTSIDNALKWQTFFGSCHMSFQKHRDI